MRLKWDFLEELLADGRQWVLGNGDGPQLADIHACWIFDWLLTLPGSFPENYFNSTRYPKVMAWRERYVSAIAPKVNQLEGPDAVKLILISEFNDDEIEIEGDDPSGLKAGETITMKPIDTGYSHEDTGKLIGLTTREVAICIVSQEDAKEVHLHYPRWNVTFEAKGLGRWLSNKE